MGFRANRSCTDSLVTLTNNIHISFLAHEVAVAFLDITGAFDNVLPEAVESPLRLKKLEFPQDFANS